MSASNKDKLLDIPKRVDTDRVTHVGDLHLEQSGFDPTVIHYSASRELTTSGIEPYQRRITIGTKPQPLDTGYVEEKDVGYIGIENLEGTRLQTQPSEEEAEDIAKRIVVVSFEANICSGIIIRPGWCFPLEPSFAIGHGKLEQIKLYCLYETAKCKLTIYPK